MLFDIAPSEFLLTALVAVVVIGPKDMPRALRSAGRVMGKIRRVSGHFRSGIETMIREAELEDMEKKWREQNAAIMQAHPDGTPVQEGQPAPVEGQADAPVNADEPALLAAPVEGDHPSTDALHSVIDPVAEGLPAPSAPADSAR